MRTIFLSLALLVAGCASNDVPPAIPQAPIKEAEGYADKQDAAISKAAGFVRAAKEVTKQLPKDEPAEILGTLLDAADSYLDEPSQEDINAGRALAKKLDPALADRIRKDAEKTRKEIDKAWEGVVADAERRKAEAEANLQRVQLELDAANKASLYNMLGMVGAGLLGIGALALAFGHMVGISKVGALSLMGAGAGVAALPRIMDDQRFIWIGLGLAGVAALQVAIFMGRKFFKKTPVDNCPPPTSDAKALDDQR